ncbi:MAG: biopolymer transporter ExbD [Candidatus Sumerlaeia bacterium]|nr:biopolymer transporter ExbD [Candidatus Sumerlaeia bacterium]
MARRHRRIAALPEPQINITSMLDIVFCLLIAFMIVAPALKNGVDLELPKVREAPRFDAKRTPHNIDIRWDSAAGEGRVFLNSKEVQVPDLVSSLKAASLASSDKPILLNSDRRVPWQEVATVITSLRAAGIGEIGLITDRGD